MVKDALYTVRISSLTWLGIPLIRCGLRVLVGAATVHYLESSLGLTVQATYRSRFDPTMDSGDRLRG